MSGATTVTITIRGRLSNRLVAAFDGMAAVACQDGTQLVGPVADQAQIHGLLARVRDLGLELESVSVSETREDGEPAPAARRPEGARA
jgi:hypothetical protein